MIISFTDKYSFLSNFYPCNIIYNNFVFPSVENAYQASKCAIEEDKLEFVTVSAGKAKRMGRQVPLRTDWESVKVDIMKNLVYQKFSNKDLQSKLLATLPNELIEGNDWNDTFWGKCNNIGEDMLGKILMEVRDTLYLENQSERI